MLFGNFGGFDTELIFELFQESESAPIGAFTTTIRELSFFSESSFQFIPTKKNVANSGVTSKIRNLPVLEVLEMIRKEPPNNYVVQRPDSDS